MVRAIILKGESGFDVDGESYRIILDATGWLAAEQTAGLSLMTLLARIHTALEAGGEPLIGDLAAILHGGLGRDHGDLTFENAVNLLMSDYPLVTAALNDAIVASLPQAEAGNVPAPAAGSGTGKRSSRSGAGRGKASKPSGRQRRA